MRARTWDTDRLRRLDAVLQRHVDDGSLPGMTWLVARGGDVHTGAAGTFGPSDPATDVDRSTIYRISSVTKPVTAVAALMLVEDCVLRLDDPVDHLLPELADRRVLADPSGPLDDTVPADRPITVGDLLTFRSGLGFDFATTRPQPVLEALADRGVPPGPPAPQAVPPPAEWMRILGSVPLAHQPGTRWLYDTSAAILGVLIARAADSTLDAVLAERVFEPLGMSDTGFHVPAGERDRFGAVHGLDPATGDRTVYDPSDGQWTTPPAFPGGNDGLVSTVDDLATLGAMLLAGGVHRGDRLLSRSTVEAMTTNQLTPDQMAASSPSMDGSMGWGLGIGVYTARVGLGPQVGSYGWNGGLGSVWAVDPSEDLVGVLLTNQMWASPEPPAVLSDFWTATYAAFGD